MSFRQIFIGLLDNAPLVLLVLVFLFPAFIALLILWPSLPSILASMGGIGTVIGYILSRTDSGGELAGGAGILRGGILLAASLWLLLPRHLPEEYRKIVHSGLAFLALTLVSAWQCSHRHDALIRWLDYLCFALVFIIVSDYARRFEGEQFFQRLSDFFLIIVLLVLPVAYFRYMLGLETLDGRMRGSFFHPNMLASYLLLFYPLLVNRVFSPFASGVAEIMTLAVTVVAVVLTGSRAGLTMMLVLTVFVLVFGGSKLEKATWLKFFCGLGGVVVVLGAYLWGVYGGGFGLIVSMVTVALLCVFVARQTFDPLFTLKRILMLLVVVSVLLALIEMKSIKIKVRNGKDTAVTMAETAYGTDASLIARLYFWAAAWEIGKEHWWLGVGPAGFHRYHPAYQKDLAYFSKFTHALWLTWWSEQGVAGLILGISVFYFLLTQTWLRCKDDINPTSRRIRLSLWGGGLGFLIVSQFDVQWQFPALPITFFTLLGTLTVGNATDESLGGDETDDKMLVNSSWTIRPRLLILYLGSLLLTALFFLNSMVTQAKYWASLADIAAQSNRVKEAVTLYKVAIKLDPLQADYYRSLGHALLLKKFSQANSLALLDAARKAVELDPHRAVNQSLLGRAVLFVKGARQARVYFRKALELDPVNYPSFYIDLADTYKSKIVREKILGAAVERFPLSDLRRMEFFRYDSVGAQLSELYVILANLYLTDKELDKAESWYAKALDLNNTKLSSWLGLEQVYLWRGEVARALEIARRLYKIEPEEENNLRILYECYRRLGSKRKSGGSD